MNDEHQKGNEAPASGGPEVETDASSTSAAEETTQHADAQPAAGTAAQKTESQTDDIAAHKTLAVVGYLLPFLFFLPLMSDEGKKSEFARFHANQHLIMLIALVALYVFHNIFYMLFFMGGFLIMQLLNLALVVFIIIGMINAAQGKMKELPFIGSFKLLKD